MTTLKTKIKSAINADQSKARLDHLKKFVVQGDLLNLAHPEESDLTWRSAIYSLPRRVLGFAINSSIDTLPTLRNLKLWGKKMSSNCKLCGNTQTLLHVLAGCKTMLDQGRYTCRHNSSELTCVELGYRRYVSESNKIRITTILKSLDIKPSKRQVKELTLSLSKLALLTSFVIFKCKDEPQ